MEAEGLLTQVNHAGRFGRFQCEAVIQSVHVQRPIIGRLNLDALAMLYDLLIRHADGISARIGQAVVMAERGDAASALADLDDLAPNRVARYEPFLVAHARFAAQAEQAEVAATSLGSRCPSGRAWRCGSILRYFGGKWRRVIAEGERSRVGVTVSQYFVRASCSERPLSAQSGRTCSRSCVEVLR